MRYYAIRISDPATGEILVPNVNGQPGFSRQPASAATWTYCSLNARSSPSEFGSTNPYAQAVELDLPVTFLHTPEALANPYVTIHGVSLAEISQASDLNGLNIAIYGGMAAGLPLANPQQINLLASGVVSQAFGRWINVSQSLSVYLWPSGSSPSAAQTTGNPSDTSTLPTTATNETPANLVFQWSPGQPLMEALIPCLSTAFPKYSIQGAVDPSLTWTGAAATGFFANLQQLAQYVNKKTLSLIGGFAPDRAAYAGVNMTLLNNTIIISDGTTRTTPKTIVFTDLIGQPTWGQPGAVQLVVVLRGDIQPGDFVTLPPGPQMLAVGAQTQFLPTPNGLGNAYSTTKNRSAFSGVFQVTAVRHVGNSRAAGGTSWVTVVDLITPTTTTTSTGSTSVVTAPVTSGVVDELPVLYKPNNTYAFFLPN